MTASLQFYCFIYSECFNVSFLLLDSRQCHSLMTRSVNRCERLPHVGAARLKWVVTDGTPSVEKHPNSVIDYFYVWAIRGHMSGSSMNVCQRYARVFLAVCDGAPSIAVSTYIAVILDECRVPDHHRARADSNMHCSPWLDDDAIFAHPRRKLWQRFELVIASHQYTWTKCQ